MYRADTIVARATPAGRGAISIVRLSGPDARSILERLFRPSGDRALEPWRMRHGVLIDPDRGDERVLDEALAVWMPAPHSYSGEDVVELHCHGSPLLVEEIVTATVRLGARSAEAGEFTRRAVLNGRLDLLQAEAVADLIDAKVELGATLAWQQLQGALSHRLAELRERLVGVLAEVEANVDFSDEELPEENIPIRVAELTGVEETVDELLAGFAVSRRLREGTRVVVAGKPNVGKSSLVNRLLGYGRMIVSPEAGTTRDSVEELIDLGGAAIVLTDTAGLRRSDSSAEGLAVARSRELLAGADLVLAVIDGSTPLDQADCEMLDDVTGRQSLLIQNKDDLPCGLRDRDLQRLQNTELPRLVVSALQGSGCEALADRLREFAGWRDEAQGSFVGISRPRHRAALSTVRERVAAARQRLQSSSEASELVALELRAALDELASITQPLDNEELLDKIFSEFCIGK